MKATTLALLSSSYNMLNAFNTVLCVASLGQEGVEQARACKLLGYPEQSKATQREHAAPGISGNRQSSGFTGDRVRRTQRQLSAKPSSAQAEPWLRCDIAWFCLWQRLCHLWSQALLARALTHPTQTACDVPTNKCAVSGLPGPCERSAVSVCLRSCAWRLTAKARGTEPYMFDVVNMPCKFAVERLLVRVSIAAKSIVWLLFCLQAGDAQTLSWTHSFSNCPDPQLYDISGLICLPCETNEVGACAVLHAILCCPPSAVAACPA